MTDITAEIAFMKMLAKLEADIRTLEDNFYHLSSDQVGREVNTANAFLSSLWDRLRLAGIDPSHVYGTLSNIQYRLRSIQLKAATRCDIPDTLRERLLRAYNFVAAAVNLVSAALGAGPILPQFPNSSEANLLKITFVEHDEKCGS